MRKAVFFDIDGTLIDSQNRIPESVAPAIAALQENGHLAVICSGRTMGFIIDPRLKAMHFDGVVSGCGTRVDYRDRTLMEYLFDEEEALFAVETARQYAFPAILEGPEYLYLDPEDFGDDRYVTRLRNAIPDNLRTIRDNWGNWVMNKFSCAVNHETELECLGIYAERFDFLRHSADVIELVPHGYDKCTGMELFCDSLGIRQEDTFAIGDSANDIGMLRWAGQGIVMGSGHDVAKKEADYVTAAIWDDGIEKALKHYELI